MIGQTIRDLRKEKRVSQTELAKIVGVSQTTVTAWETGKAEPSSSAVSNLADYFNVTTDYLLGRPEKKKEKQNVELTDDDIIMTYQGKELSEEDREIIKRLIIKRAQTSDFNQGSSPLNYLIYFYHNSL